jgi:methyl-accepting chemotaxis protein
MTRLAGPWLEKVGATTAKLQELDRLVETGAREDSAEVQRLREQARATYVETRAMVKPLDQAFPKVLAAVTKEAHDQASSANAAGDRASTLMVAALVAVIVLVLSLAVVLPRHISGIIRSLVSEVGRITEAVGAGRLAERGDADVVHFQVKDVVEGLNATLDAYQRPVAMAVENLGRLASGNVPAKISDAYQGDFNQIKNALNGCIDAVNLLVTDAGMLAKAGVEGRLATRADASRHQGDFRKVVQGVNDTLDAVIGPLNVAAKYVDQISKGQIPEKITVAYAGDFNAIKENLNRCIEAVNRLVSDAGMLAQAGMDGRLATRADASRHEGDFRKVVDGVNKTLDAVIGPLNVAAKYVDQISKGQIPAKITDAYAGDFNTIKTNLNTCVGAVNLLVADAGKLVEAAVAGQLSTRADASQHQGDFRKIVVGVNETLDAVMAPITEAAGVLQRLAERDLRARVTGNYQGDHARIKESVNATGVALHDAMAQVAQAVDQVSSASTQIAASSQAVASGASEQAASLEETSTSIESVSGMTKQAADNAQQANQLAKTARTAATDGSAAVEQMQGAMGKIKASAEGTSQIIKDINDIAFQTNLLALNAAVEAARAGEAGRGFAVVAEEVRSLALRAKEAATKTEELIRQSVKEAVQGEVTAKQVAGKLGEIATGVSKVSDIVAEIASAAQAQATGIEQVTKAITEMDKVTQQNAASAEESSSAASELSGQSEELAAMVAAFQLETQGRSHAAAAAPRRALTLPAPTPRAPAHSSKWASPGVQPGVRNGDAPSPGRQESRGAAPLRADDAFPMDEGGDLKDF